MDPLSVTASILAVLAAAQTGLSGLGKLKACWNAPHEIEKLLDELSDLQDVLQEINRYAPQARHAPDEPQIQILMRRVDIAGTKIAEINDLLTNLSPHVSGLGNASQARLVWLRSRNKVNVLRQDLHDLRLDLAMIMNLLTASSTTYIRGCMETSIEAQVQNSKMLTLILQKMLDMEVRKPESHTDYSSAAKPCQNLGLPGLNITASSQTDSAYTPSSSHPNTSWQVAKFRPQKCVEWCSCACHADTSWKLPWIIKSVFGELLVEYTGNASEKVACNENSCRRPPPRAFSVTYRLPLHQMSRYLIMVLQHTTLEGPKFSLRMPRMIGLSHLLWKFIRNRDMASVQRLFSTGQASQYDISPYGSNALHFAARRGYAKLGQLLLDNGADANLVNGAGRRPPYYFWQSFFSRQLNDEEAGIVKGMFKNLFSVQTCKFTPLHKIVLGLIDRDLEAELTLSTANIDSTDRLGRTPLCWATIRDYTYAVKILLAFGADPNISDMSGYTCLHFARSTQICGALLSSNADVHARDRAGARSPLHSACRDYDVVGVTNLLIQAGSDVDVRDDHGVTPLMSAIYNQFTSVAKRLIDLGANLNACNRQSGDAAVHYAVWNDQYDILPLLLQKGAKYNAKNAEGKNAAHLAAERGDAATMTILSEAGLKDLDVSSRDAYGKTPADYISERTILADDELGIHEAFEKLIANLSASSLSGISTLEPPSAGTVCLGDHEDQIQSGSRERIPGAYPATEEG